MFGQYLTLLWSIKERCSIGRLNQWACLLCLFVCCLVGQIEFLKLWVLTNNVFGVCGGSCFKLLYFTVNMKVWSTCGVTPHCYAIYLRLLLFHWCICCNLWLNHLVIRRCYSINVLTSTAYLNNWFIFLCLFILQIDWIWLFMS